MKAFAKRIPFTGCAVLWRGPIDSVIMKSVYAGYEVDFYGVTFRSWMFGVVKRRSKTDVDMR